jgi:hypothetical protein
VVPVGGVASGMGHGSDAQQRLFWQVSSFLHALAAERPIALLLDDLHWADGGQPGSAAASRPPHARHPHSPAGHLPRGGGGPYPSARSGTARSGV